MKKIIALTATALTLAGGAEARKFDGAYAGLSYGFGQHNLKMQTGGTAPVGKHHKGTGSAVHAILGWGDLACTTYYGFDLRAGYDWFKKKKEGDRLKAGWTYGVGARVGRVFNNDWLAFFRLGVDRTEYEFKYSYSGAGYKDNMRVWSVVPGIGMEYAFNNMFNVGLSYEYAVGFTQQGNRGEHYKASRLPRNHHARLAFTFAF